MALAGERGTAPIVCPKATLTSGERRSDESVSASSKSMPAAPEDPLLPWLSTTSTFARAVAAAIDTEGYILLPGVFSQRECEVEMDRLWAYVEATTGGRVRRDDPSTWYPSASSTAEEEDPWPHSGWRSFPDMFQSFQAGWLFSDLREALAQRVFEPLYGTRELHSSKEGFTFHRPTARGAHPSSARQTFVCGAPTKRSSGEHFDQSSSTVGLHCIQSSTALLDQTTDPDAGCFLCWPGSHGYHARLTAGTYRGRKDWVPLTDAELGWLEDAGLQPRRVRAAAGDVILWRSDLVHAAAPPGPNATSFRAVVYTCMLPVGATYPKRIDEADRFGNDERQFCDKMPSHHIVDSDVTPDSSRRGVYGSIPGGHRKLTAYLQTETGDHRPGEECWLSPKPARAAVVRGAFFERNPPSLTWRQAELYGLVPYLPVDLLLGTDAQEREELRRAAELRGVRFVSDCWANLHPKC